MRRLLLNICKTVFCGLLIASCSTTGDNSVSPNRQKSIVILYDNDVHCHIDGYTRMAGLRDAILAADTAYVGITSSGDFINGDVAGAISRGQYIVDIIRTVGYTAIAPGNHEFDFGIPRLLELTPKLGAPVVCSNFYKVEDTNPIYQTYTIRQFGEKRVAFVGATTPEALMDEKYSFYDKDGKQTYDLRTDKVFSLVQQSVDAARNAGADYVVMLSHLGEKESYTGVDSHTLISKTHGIDVVLDGHTHSVVPHDVVSNDRQELIGVTQTGTAFANIGKLVISPEGKITTELLSSADVPYTNSHVTATTDSVVTLMHQETDRVLGMSKFNLTIRDSKGNRLVRKGETNLSDLVTDALRVRTGADIGLYNGGGIRNDIPAGTINYGNAISVLPFYNLTCTIEATGEMIVQMLEKCLQKYPEEEGHFPQISGMKFTLHTVSHKVSDVLVLNRSTDTYEPIVADKKYSIGISDYYANGGFYDSLKDATLTKLYPDQNCKTLADFIEFDLGGMVGEEYRESQGRITFIED